MENLLRLRWGRQQIFDSWFLLWVNLPMSTTYLTQFTNHYEDSVCPLACYLSGRLLFLLHSQDCLLSSGDSIVWLCSPKRGWLVFLLLLSEAEMEEHSEVKHSHWSQYYGLLYSDSIYLASKFLQSCHTVICRSWFRLYHFHFFVWQSKETYHHRLIPLLRSFLLVICLVHISQDHSVLYRKQLAQSSFSSGMISSTICSTRLSRLQHSSLLSVEARDQGCIFASLFTQRYQEFESSF